MDIKILQKLKKYPYLGYSPNLIEYFLIIGFDSNFKADTSETLTNNIKEIINSAEKIEKIEKPESEGQDLKDKLNLHKIQSKPVVLNSIGSDFSDGMLNEDVIINHMFPNNYTQIYTSNINNEKRNKKIEPANQNLVFYLSCDKIFEKKGEDDAQNPDEKNKLNNKIMFNIYGYLFWETNINENCKVFFPKVFVFISQYSYFKYFSFLSQNILFRLKKNIYFEIPLEIQLYNIVNFTPSPIICDLQLEPLANIDLVAIKTKPKDILTYFPKVKYDEEKDEFISLKVENECNNITLLQLSGYPYFDIDISYLFNYFNFESFFTTYLFSFLEFKMIFFSPALDFLNTTMYIIRFLSYPFIDNKDLGQIYSVTKDEFLYSSSPLENNLIGVNTEYDPKMPIPPFYKDYFIISFNTENKSTTIYFNGQNIANSDLDKENSIVKLIRFIENSTNEETEKKALLEKRIFAMHNSLHQCFKIIMNNNSNFNNDNNELIKDFFKEVELNENNYKYFYYRYEEYDEYNATIQKAIYKFNLSVYEMFHDTAKLILKNPQAVKASAENYQSIFYGIRFEQYTDKILCEEEKIFFNLFKKTSKYDQFLNCFIKKNLCSDLARPSIVYAEEFMNYHKAFEKEDNRDYLQILNDIYPNMKKVALIDFKKFYYHYSQKLLKSIYNMSLDTKIINLINESKNNITKIIYRQKEFLLDDNILKRYVYLLNNMEEKEFESLFLSLKFKQIENNVPEVNSTFFADSLESMLIKEKFISTEEIIIFIIFIIYIACLKKNKIIFHFFEEIMEKVDKIEIKQIQYEKAEKEKAERNEKTEKSEKSQKPKMRKVIMRKYIYIILSILNDLVKEKINKKENYIKELLIYQEIMNCIYKSNSNLLRPSSRIFYPNERLSDIIYNFNQYQKNYEEILAKNTSFVSYCKLNVKKYYSKDNKDILEDGVHYKVLMQNNACRDKGAVKDDVLVTISEILENKGLISTTCKACQLKIEPNLFFVHVPLDRSSKVGFYTIWSIYKMSQEILKATLSNNATEKSKADEELFVVIGNIIYNNNLKDGINNKLSNFLATCLK